MKKIGLAGLALFFISRLTLAQQSPIRDFKIDYFGFPLRMQCSISQSYGRGDTPLKQLVDKDSQEVKDCLASLQKLSDQYRIKSYAQLLLFQKFVAAISGAGTASPSTSFADAVLKNQALDKNDQAALLYAMMSKSKYGCALYETDAGNLLLLSINQRIEGIKDGKYYIWQPGKNLTELPPVSKSTRVRQKLFNEGYRITFEQLPDIPWLMTGEGPELKFKSPAGCPASWSFSARRLPDYEQFLSLWPRSDTVLGSLSFSMLKPFGFEQVFSPKPSGMSDEQFGTCLLNWVQINTEYDQEHAQEFIAKTQNMQTGKTSTAGLDVRKQNRNPVETLFVNRKGVCSELSVLLIGILQAAGFTPENIMMAFYDPGTTKAHLNLAVEPINDDLREDAVYLEINGIKFYIMDPANYIYGANKKLMTRWGDTPYKSRKGVSLFSISENSQVTEIK